jgi:hypothetical protein
MGWTFPWYSSYGSDFNYDFHATLDDRVVPVLLHFRTEAELAEAGTPWTGGPWTESMRGEELPGISAFLRVGEPLRRPSTMSGMDASNEPRVALLGHGSWGPNLWPGTCTCASADAAWRPVRPFWR